MKELEDIVQRYQEVYQQGIKAALATVVHVEGSSYRRPGARMLITEKGELTGAISGGCLEGDALRKAQLAMMQDRPMLVTYDTMDEDDAKLGVGLGCNGIIHILLEPLYPRSYFNPLLLLQAVAGTREATVMVTLFDLQYRNAPQPGTCLLLSNHGLFEQCIADSDLLLAVKHDAQQALDGKHHALKNYHSGGQQLTALIAFQPPAVQLLVAGAGNDVMPLVKMAAILGWQTLVADGRPAYATASRFPEAGSVIAAKPHEVLSHFTVDAYTAVVLMTHNYNYDLAMLTTLLPQAVRYTGVLGPAKKLERMLSEMEATGIRITPEQRERIYGPAGLDLDAETADEIALSIISEIRAAMGNASAQPLRNKKTSIHSKSD
ncbi:XdhC family protein [Chitinophaga sp. Mgbs1]|uniref:XdhC family protein n=1 Tax=Chitinophaga solisilvae TaxID=1233460 RepID=A0A3S1AZZ1_9BACT|nr:XdhC family protein [Chitinophaga solisilvae]